MKRKIIILFLSSIVTIIGLIGQTAYMDMKFGWYSIPLLLVGQLVIYPAIEFWFSYFKKILKYEA